MPAFVAVPDFVVVPALGVEGEGVEGAVFAGAFGAAGWGAGVCAISTAGRKRNNPRIYLG